jgi:hypothetical protein
MNNSSILQLIGFFVLTIGTWLISWGISLNVFWISIPSLISIILGMILLYKDFDILEEPKKVEEEMEK